MPNNRLIYYGVLLIAASALIWVGAWLTKRVEWILPYTGAAGAALVVLGLAMEMRRKNAPAGAPAGKGAGE